MSSQTFEGVVEGGQIRLDPRVQLPERTKVLVIVLEASRRPTQRIVTPRLAHPEQIIDFQMQVEELPGDACV
jgi:hypothetical protein